MARFSGGWVKLHRDILETFKDDLHGLGLYSYLMMIANWCDGEIKVRLPQGWGFLKKGEVITSIGELSLWFDLPKKTVKNILDRLENRGLIVSVRAHSGTHLTICKYTEIQSSDDLGGHTGVSTLVHAKIPIGVYAEVSTSDPHSEEEEGRRKKEEEAHTGTPRLESLINEWNLNCGSLPKTMHRESAMQPHIALQIQRRFQEQPGIDYWITAIKKMATSSFCLSKGFANFDWLIANEENHVKVMSCKFDDKPVERLSEFQRRQKLPIWEQNGFKTLDEMNIHYAKLARGGRVER